MSRTLMIAVTVAFVVALSGSGEAADRRLRISNSGGKAIVEIFAKQEGRREWSPNVLGAETIGPRSFRMINFGAGGPCLFNLRIVFADGVQHHMRGLDVCHINAMTFEG